MSKFLNFFAPFVRFTPEVKSPDRDITFREKLFWTAIVLIIYLVMSNMSLYGIPKGQGYDYLYWMRVILASKRGTLTELGIGPIVTAGLIMQLLAGSKIIEVDFSDPEDRALFTGAQKVLAIIITVFQAFAYLYAKAFGSLSFENSVAVFLQLVAAGILIILLDETLQKGWGLGSGVSLFIATNTAELILWGAFSPLPTGDQGDGLYRGAVLAFFQLMIDAAGTGKWRENLIHAFNRPNNLPDMSGVLATIVVFLVVIYLEACRVEIPVSYARFRGFKGKYPIKLLYVSNIPVILVQALYANLIFFGQLFWSRWKDTNNVLLSLFVKALGQFEPAEEGGYLQPTGGLVYYLTPPRSLETIATEPLRAIIYLIVFVALCAMFSSVWIEVSGIGPRDIAYQLLQAGMQVPGFRRSPKIIEKILERYIPTVTVLGGVIVGLIAALADFLGALGTGVGVLLTVGIIYQYYQIIAQEQLAEIHPALRGLLGIE